TNDDSEIRYVYDEVGNITQIYRDEVLENEYEYDSLNQLSLEKTYSLNQKVEYTYDNGGNILTKVYKYLDTDAIINTYTYSYDTNWKDQLINYNGNAITYDEIGNPLTYGNNITYSWINGRELETYTDTSKNVEVEYAYNDEGIRTSKIVNGVEHKYYLEGTNIIYETIGENTLYYFYDSTGSIEGFKYNNDLYYYIKNGQNDIIGIIDDEGNQVVSYTYDSWGQIISITDNLGTEITDPTNIGNINPFRYRSYYYDGEIGLYYLNSRYYNPEMSRFLNADGYVSTAQGLMDSNMFVYTSNNPIIRSDMTGNVWDTVLDIVGVSISFTDFIKKPTWGTFGLLAADAGLAILPFVPSISGVKAGVKIVNKVDNVVDTAKTGWKVGDNITNFTRAGNAPAWNTVKSRYWKNEAFYNPNIYNPDNLSRMRKGNAPLATYKLNGRMYPMELHHINGRNITNPHNLNNLQPLTPWDHSTIDPYRHWNP
ncbi:MAG: RHS repeat-associated core domain-containing protein, partial [Ignavibacteriales bacterium]